jgi:GNAT superfamily N-acetyltransferase
VIIPVSNDNVKELAVMYTELFPEDDTAAAEWIEEWENGGLPYEFLYFVDGEAAAFISLALRHDYVEGTDSSPVGYLEGIYVKPNFRKRGIAKELVQFAKEWALSHNCTEFASDCELANEESRLFHTQMGFEEANRIICFTMDLVN